jgi:hypothetical protein
MTDDDPDHQVQDQRRRHRPRRLIQAFSSPDSYGLVLLLILATYALSATITAAWAVSLVLFAQVATIWVTLQASQAHRRLREVTSVLLIVTAVVAILNLFIAREPSGRGVMAVVSGLLYLAAPVIIVRRLVARRTVDTQTVLGAIAAYLMVGMSFAFAYRALGALQAARSSGRRGGQLLPGPVLLVHHPDHDRVRQPGAGRQPGADLRGAGDADRAAVPGDRGSQGGEHLAAQPTPRAPPTETNSN